MSTALTLWALISALFSLVCVFRVRRLTPQVAPPHPDEVLLLRPVDSPSAMELKALATPAPPGVRHVAVAPYRGAIPTHLEWLPSDPSCPNRKVGHLAYALSVMPRHSVVLAVDADVMLTEELVSELVAAIQRGAAIATAAPLPQRPLSLGSAVWNAVLSHTHQAFRALDAMPAGAPAVCGKAMALGPKAQQLLPQLKQHLGEDLELSLRLHAAGQGVTQISTPATVAQAESFTLSDALARLTRWMQVIRAHRPELFPAVGVLFASTPVLVPLLALQNTWWPVVGLLVCRTALALKLRAGWSALLWPLGEAGLLWAWISALTRTHVLWRNRRLTWKRGGLIREVPLAPRESPT